MLELTSALGDLKSPNLYTCYMEEPLQVLSRKTNAIHCTMRCTIFLDGAKVIQILMV